MSIAHFKPTVNRPGQLEQTPALPNNYKGNIYDNNKTPLQGLIAYISGASWTVDYYRQQISEHSDLKELDPNLDAAYQGYEKITGLEIRVDSQLSSTTDINTQQTTVRGTGYIYPFMIPNRNDYFVTDTSYGKKALFLVRTSERKTFQENSVHLIEYILVRYMDDTDELFLDLQKKTTRTLVFSKDRLIEGLSPFLKTETYESITQLVDDYKDIIQRYFATFLNPKCYTLVLPGQPELVYDPFLMEYLFSNIDTFDAPEIRRVKRYQTDGDVFMEQPHFWSMLQKRRYDLLEECNVKMGYAVTGEFDHNSYIRGAYHGVVEKLIYPRDMDKSYLSGYATFPKTVYEYIPTPTVNYKGSQVSPMENQHTLLNGLVSIYPTVTFTNSYVLTPDFYTNAAGMSILEIMVKDYLKCQTLSLEYLKLLVGLYPKLARMEQFYYGPILLVLIKEVIRSAY